MNIVYTSYIPDIAIESQVLPSTQPGDHEQ